MKIPDEMKLFIKTSWEESGFLAPTEVQQQSFKHLLANRSLIAESPTGTGKTLAYLLPVLTKIEVSSNAIQAIIIVPSKELAMQIFEIAKIWGVPGQMRITSLIGGVSLERQISKLKEKPHIIIGTPGRIDELILKKKLKVHQAKIVIIDEVDSITSGEQLVPLTHILKSLMRDCQLGFFSATMSEKALEFANRWGRAPVTVQVLNRSQILPQVTHLYMTCDKRDKLKLIEKLSNSKKRRMLIFIQDIGNLQVYAEKLAFKKINLAILHSEVKKIERKKTLEEFQAGKLQILLATDLAARGLDILNLSFVINFDCPRTKEVYLHRAGRCGRHEVDGVVITLITPNEEQSFCKLTRKIGVNAEKVFLFKGEIVRNKKGE